MSNRKNKAVAPPVCPVETSAEIPGETVPPENKAEIRAKNGPVEFTESLAGTYRTTEALNLRAQPNGEIMTALPRGQIVTSEGGYTEAEGKTWLFVETDLAETHYAGFCVSLFLERV